MDTGLAGKVVFLTGASGGIGRAVADAFAAEGAQLALQGHRRFDELEALVAERPWRDRALVLRADITQPDEVQAALDATARSFGRVDVCIANAGVWPPADLPVHEVDEDRVREVVSINLLGAVWTARAFLRVLAAAGPRPDGEGASLAFTGSTAGRFGERGHADYALSKAGLYGLLRTLKNEIVDLDPYGRVNLVEPGWTVTEMVRAELDDDDHLRRVASTMPLRQLARAADIARTLVFLSSPRLARHITGQVLTVAGGMEGRRLWEAGQVDPGEIRARLDPDPG